MKHQVLRRTLLAVAVASISASAIAAPFPSEFDMTGQTESLVRTGAVNGFSLIGSATINQDFVEINEATVTGDVINNANITGIADQINGIDVDGFELGGSTEFNGNLTNNGNLTLTGLGANGILLDNVAMNGSVLNNGSLNVTGDFDDVEGDGATGIKFWNVAAMGDTRNDGTINVNGDRAKGMLIENSALEGYLINGNGGVIDVKGANTDGIYAYDSNIEVTVNHGVIKAEGAGATGMDYDRVNMRTIINSGLIQGKGENSIGLMLDGVSLDHDSELEISQHGIVNAGSIIGERYGITIDGDITGDDIPLYINMNGGSIEGGTAAINGNGNNVVLNWNGGVIGGDLLDIGAINIDGFTTFEGNLIRGNHDSTLTVGNGSYLNLDGPTTTVTENLSVAANGSIRLLITPETNPAEAVLNVGGTASFASGSSIYLEARPFDFAPNSAGTNYLLVNAGNLQNDGVAVNSVSYLLEVKDVIENGGQLVAVLALKDYEEIKEIITESGAGANGQAAFMPFVSVLGQMDENDPIFQAIVNATPEERAKLAEQLVPEVNGGSTQAAVSGQSLVTGATSSRTSSLRGDSSGEVLAETGAWFQILSSDADQGERDGIEGYNADTKGFTLGADGKVNENLTVGLAYSYLESDVKSDSGNTTDVEGHSITAYSGLTYNQWFADGNLTYSKNDNTSKRHIAGTTAKGDYDSSMIGLNIEGGYNFDLSSTRSIAPIGILRYASVDIDGYDESGSSAALQVDAQRYEIAEVGMGFKFSDSVRLGKGMLTSEVKLAATYDLIGDTTNTSSSFILGGNAFTTNGADPARTAISAGIGADYQIGSFTVGVNYERLNREDFHADTVIGKVRYDF
jgi:outer membrane autotransporter protein